MSAVLFFVHHPGAAATAAVAGVAMLAWLAIRRLRPGADISAAVGVSGEAEQRAWEGRAAEQNAEAEGLRSTLAQAFEARGYELHDGLGAICRRYLDDCAVRARNAVELSRKVDLEHRLAAAESQEQQACDYERRKAEVLARVEELARQCSVFGDTRAQLNGLHAWQQAHAEHLRALQAAIGKWEELQGILQGRTLEELAQEASEKAREAGQVCTALRPGDIDAFLRESRAPTSVSVRAARDSAIAARTAADHEAGEVREMARSLTSVAEAEEGLPTSADRARARATARAYAQLRPRVSPAGSGHCTPQHRPRASGNHRRVASDRYQGLVFSCSRRPAVASSPDWHTNRRNA